MSESFVFPYGITLQEEGVIDTFPVAEVFFLSKEDGWLSLFLLIDSGAAISALPKTDAPTFDILPESGIPISILGIGESRTKGWRHELSVRFRTKVRKIPFIFLDNERAPRVLGREGVFSNFTIVFEEKGGRSGFLGSTTPKSKSVVKILDSVAKELH